jgi:transposase
VNIKGAKDSLRGLLWCNSPTVSKFVSRDRNAALNILRCAMSTKRPKSLERRNERTIVIIGKYIKDCSKSHND